MQYDPKNHAHRRELAAGIVAELERLGFTRRASAGEAVYAREREPNVAVLVYTTVVGAEVRSVGEDAIRVALVYEGQPRSRGLAKDRAVHRVGTITAIVGRLRERVEGANVAELSRCRDCNGPTFLSRAGSPTCAAICWERHDKQPDRQVAARGQTRFQAPPEGGRRDGARPLEPALPAAASAPARAVASRPAAQPSVESVPVMGKRDRNAPHAVDW